MAKRKKRAVNIKKKKEDTADGTSNGSDDGESTEAPPPSKKVAAASSTSHLEDEPDPISSFSSIPISHHDTGDGVGGVVSHFWCNYCEFSADTKNELVKHMRSHMIKCNHCPFSSLSRNEVVRHSKYEHDKEFDAVPQEVSSSNSECILDKDPCSACVFCDFQTYSTEHLEHHTALRHPGMFTKSVAKMISKEASTRVRQDDAAFYLKSATTGETPIPISDSSTVIVLDETKDLKKEIKPCLAPVGDEQNEAGPGGHNIAVEEIKVNHPVKTQNESPSGCVVVPKEKSSGESTSPQEVKPVIKMKPEVKVKVETMYCMICPYSNVAIEKLKCHTISQHPPAAAVATFQASGEGLSPQDITFFCVREDCNSSSDTCHALETHLMECCSCSPDLTQTEEKRLKATVDFLLEFQKKNSLKPVSGFFDFVSSRTKLISSVTTTPNSVVSQTWKEPAHINEKRIENDSVKESRFLEQQHNAQYKNGHYQEVTPSFVSPSTTNMTHSSSSGPPNQDRQLQNKTFFQGAHAPTHHQTTFNNMQNKNVQSFPDSGQGFSSSVNGRNMYNNVPSPMHPTFDQPAPPSSQQQVGGHGFSIGSNEPHLGIGIGVSMPDSNRPHFHNQDQPFSKALEWGASGQAFTSSNVQLPQQSQQPCNSKTQQVTQPSQLAVQGNFDSGVEPASGGSLAAHNVQPNFRMDSLSSTQNIDLSSITPTIQNVTLDTSLPLTPSNQNQSTNFQQNMPSNLLNQSAPQAQAQSTNIDSNMDTSRNTGMYPDGQPRMIDLLSDSYSVLLSDDLPEVMGPNTTAPSSSAPQTFTNMDPGSHSMPSMSLPQQATQMQAQPVNQQYPSSHVNLTTHNEAGLLPNSEISSQPPTSSLFSESSLGQQSSFNSVQQGPNIAVSKRNPQTGFDSRQNPTGFRAEQDPALTTANANSGSTVNISRSNPPSSHVPNFLGSPANSSSQDVVFMNQQSTTSTSFLHPVPASGGVPTTSQAPAGRNQNFESSSQQWQSGQVISQAAPQIPPGVGGVQPGMQSGTPPRQPNAGPMGASPLSPSIYLSGQAPRHRRSNWSEAELRPRGMSLPPIRAPRGNPFPKAPTGHPRQRLFAPGNSRGRIMTRGPRMPQSRMPRPQLPVDDDVIVTAVIRGVAPQRPPRGTRGRSGMAGSRGRPGRGFRPQGLASQNQRYPPPPKPVDISKHFEDLACVVNANGEEEYGGGDDIQIVGVTPGKDNSKGGQPKAVDSSQFSFCCVHCGKDQGSKIVMKQHMKALHNDSLLGAFRNTVTGQLLFFCPQIKCEFMTYDEQRLIDHLYKCYGLDKSKQLPFDLHSALKNLGSLKIHQVNTGNFGQSQENPINLDGSGLKDTFNHSLTDAFHTRVESSSGRQVMRPPSPTPLQEMLSSQPLPQNRPSSWQGQGPQQPSSYPQAGASRGRMMNPYSMQMNVRSPGMYGPPPRGARGAYPRGRGRGARMRMRGPQPAQWSTPRKPLPPGRPPLTQGMRPPAPVNVQGRLPGSNQQEPIVIDLDGDSPEASPRPHGPASSEHARHPNLSLALSTTESVPSQVTARRDSSSTIDQSNPTPQVWPPRDPSQNTAQAFQGMDHTAAGGTLGPAFHQQQTDQAHISASSQQSNDLPVTSDPSRENVLGQPPRHPMSAQSMPNPGIPLVRQEQVQQVQSAVPTEGAGQSATRPLQEASDSAQNEARIRAEQAQNDMNAINDEEEQINAIVLEKVFAKVPDMPKRVSRKLVSKFKQYAAHRGVKITPDSKVIDEFVSKIYYKGLTTPAANPSATENMSSQNATQSPAPVSSDNSQVQNKTTVQQSSDMQGSSTSDSSCTGSTAVHGMEPSNGTSRSGGWDNSQPSSNCPSSVAHSESGSTFLTSTTEPSIPSTNFRHDSASPLDKEEGLPAHASAEDSPDSEHMSGAHVTECSSVANTSDVVATKIILAQSSMKFSGTFAKIAEMKLMERNKSAETSERPTSVRSGHGQNQSGDKIHRVSSDPDVSTCNENLQLRVRSSSTSLVNLAGSQSFAESVSEKRDTTVNPSGDARIKRNVTTVFTPGDSSTQICEPSIESIVTYGESPKLLAKGCLKEEPTFIEFPAVSNEETDPILVKSSVDHLVVGHKGLEVDIAGKPVTPFPEKASPEKEVNAKDLPSVKSAEKDAVSDSMTQLSDSGGVVIKTSTAPKNKVMALSIVKTKGKIGFKVKKKRDQSPKQSSADKSLKMKVKSVKAQQLAKKKGTAQKRLNSNAGKEVEKKDHLEEGDEDEENKKESSEETEENIVKEDQYVRRSERKRKVLHAGFTPEESTEMDMLMSDDDDEYHMESDEDYDSDGEWSRSGKKRAKKMKAAVDPTAFDLSTKGQFRCWVCTKVFSRCTFVRKHIMVKHQDGLCALDMGSLEEGIAQLVLFCARDCKFATISKESMEKHMESCENPLVTTNGEKLLKSNEDFLMNSYAKLLEAQEKALEQKEKAASDPQEMADGQKEKNEETTEVVKSSIDPLCTSMSYIMDSLSTNQQKDCPDSASTIQQQVSNTANFSIGLENPVQSAPLPHASTEGAHLQSPGQYWRNPQMAKSSETDVNTAGGVRKFGEGGNIMSPMSALPTASFSVGKPMPPPSPHQSRPNTSHVSYTSSTNTWPVSSATPYHHVPTSAQMVPSSSTSLFSGASFQQASEQPQSQTQAQSSSCVSQTRTVVPITAQPALQQASARGTEEYGDQDDYMVEDNGTICLE